VPKSSLQGTASDHPSAGALLDPRFFFLALSCDRLPTTGLAEVTAGFSGQHWCAIGGYLAYRAPVFFSVQLVWRCVAFHVRR
jgi:hypothetical protein